MKGAAGSLLVVLLAGQVWAHAAAPPNDAQGQAFRITALPYVYTTWRQSEADVELGESEPGCVPATFGISNSVWFDLVSTTTGRVSFDTSLSAPKWVGSVGDTVLAVYESANGALRQVGCNSASADGSAVLHDVRVHRGTHYAIQLANFDASVLTSSGLLVLRVSALQPLPPVDSGSHAFERQP